MGQRKKWQDLTITDDYMFKLVMEHKRLCKHLIECVLNIKIRDIIYLEKEKTVKNSYGSKGIRLDVYVEDEANTRFLLEMQVSDYGHREIARRSRYYQSTIDFDFLAAGKDYDELGDSYVIFFCPFKLFDGERCLYTYRNICAEKRQLELDDGAVKVFLSSAGKSRAGLHKDAAAFLEYMAGKLTNNGFVQEMDDTIIHLKEDKEQEAAYMRLNLWLEDEKKEARAENQICTAKRLLQSMRKKGESFDEENLQEVADIIDLPLSRIEELARQEGLLS